MGNRTQAPKRGSGRPVRSSKSKQQATNRVVLWTVVGAAILIVAGIAIYQTQLLRRAPAGAARVGEGTAWGPSGAPVTVINYSNFGCGHCRNFALSTGEQLRQEYEATGQVRFEFKHFRLGDPSTTDAANAAECAADQGRFWDYHDLLFGQQGVSANPFSKAALKQYGTQLGLNTSEFNQCVDSGAHLEKVYRDSQDGLAQGVEGTPTFFINGQQLVGDVPYEQFKATIDEALSASAS